jgi:hypothetical protein
MSILRTRYRLFKGGLSGVFISRLKMGRERLDNALKELKMICRATTSSSPRNNYSTFSTCGIIQVETDLKGVKHKEQLV